MSSGPDPVFKHLRIILPQVDLDVYYLWFWQSANHVIQLKFINDMYSTVYHGVRCMHIDFGFRKRAKLPLCQKKNQIREHYWEMKTMKFLL